MNRVVYNSVWGVGRELLIPHLRMHALSPSWSSVGDHPSSGDISFAPLRDGLGQTTPDSPSVEDANNSRLIG